MNARQRRKARRKDPVLELVDPYPRPYTRTSTARPDFRSVLLALATIAVMLAAGFIASILY